MTDEDSIKTHEKEFHNTIREYLICLLIFMGLYGISYKVVSEMKKISRNDDLFGTDREDYLIYRLSVWACSFSLAVSLAAVLLVPFSIFGNEILILHPDSFYVIWLNASLIQSLWNYVFLFSNISLFILIPFIYLLIESQGFTGQKGLMVRVYESLATLALSITIICCLVHLLSIWLSEPRSRSLALFKIWNYQLPFIYSCTSLIGVVALLASTPLGIVRLFSVVDKLIAKPNLKRTVDEDYMVAKLHEETLMRKLNHSNGLRTVRRGSFDFDLQKKELLMACSDTARKRKEARRRTWLRNLIYPLVMVLLLVLTALTAFLVALNTIQLVVGFRDLPYNKDEPKTQFGRDSLSALGLFGVFVEIVIICYLVLASLVGLYSIPFLKKIRPERRQTSMTKVIGNCALLLMLSSASPLLARILGISNFDLLGDYGRLDWLKNFKLVLLYNVLFATASGLCLTTKFTSSIRRNLYAIALEVGGKIKTWFQVHTI